MDNPNKRAIKSCCRAERRKAVAGRFAGFTAGFAVPPKNGETGAKRVFLSARCLALSLISLAAAYCVPLLRPRRYIIALPAASALKILEKPTISSNSVCLVKCLALLLGGYLNPACG
jgi:hypothetical protein